MITLGSHQNMEYKIRDRAIVFIGWVLKYNSKLFLTSNLIQPTLNMIFQLITTPEPPNSEDEDETIFKAGTSILDHFCKELPSKIVFDVVVNGGFQLLKRSPDSNGTFKRAGIAVLACVAEGCYEKTKINLPKFVPVIVNMFNSQFFLVRKSCCMVCTNFSEYCSIEFGKYFKSLMPPLIKSLNDNSESVRKEAVLAIDRYCCNCIKKLNLVNYSKPLLMNLFNLVKNSNVQMKIKAISAIESVVEKLRENFIPFFDVTMGMLKVIIQNPQKFQNLVLRGRAIECIGMISKSVGKDKFAIYMDSLLPNILNGLKKVPQQGQMGNQSECEFHEYSFNFIFNVAVTFEEDQRFLKYLPGIVEVILTVLGDADGMLEKFNKSGQFLEEKKCFGEDDGGEVIDLREFYVNINTSKIEEKCSALNCLGGVATSTKLRFLPYFETVAARLFQFVNYFHPFIKRKVVEVLGKMYLSIIPYPLPPENQRTIQLQSKLQNTFDPLVTIYARMLIEDQDKETVSIVCDCIADIAESVGFIALKNNFKELGNAIVDLFKKDAECFDESESFVLFPDNLKNTFMDHDTVLFDNLCNVNDQVCKASGMKYAPVFKEIFPILLVYMKHDAAHDRSAVIGVFTEAIVGFGTNIAPFFNQILKEVFNNENHLDGCVQRNSFFYYGIICQYCPKMVHNHIPKILNILTKCVLNKKEYDLSTVDNAVSSIAKIIMIHNVHLEKLIPILVNNLPLLEDMEENETVYSCILKLLDKKNPIIAKFMLKIFKIFSVIMEDSYELQIGIKQNIGKYLKFLKVNYMNQVQQIFQSLNQQERNILSRFM